MTPLKTRPPTFFINEPTPNQKTTVVFSGDDAQARLLRWLRKVGKR